MNPVSVLMKGLIRGYQLVISPLLPANCRYHPTCSQYGLEAISRHGPLKGGWLTAARLGRCHPWGGFGEDPVPEHFHFFKQHHRGCGHGDDTPPAPRVSGKV